MTLINKVLIGLAAVSVSSVALASDPLANTTWQTYDEGKPKAVIKITEKSGVLSGKIISTTNPEGSKFIGKTIISGLKSSGGGKYTGGSITDPEKNKTYKLTASLNGSTLNLKGHLGPFSRAQTWKKK